MPTRRDPQPPRPIAIGDIVTTFSEEIGEWTAAQITHFDYSWLTADVVNLDWSGPEPESLDELGELTPLRLTHHSYSGQLSHCNFPWLLPRSYRILGNSQPLVDSPSKQYGGGWAWGLGTQLSLQRRWDAAESAEMPTGRLALSGTAIADLAESDESIWDLSVDPIVTVDCRQIVRLFPNLAYLRLEGELGTLDNALALNDLPHLRGISIDNLFGMTAADIPDPALLRHLDSLFIHSAPAEYIAAVRRAWKPEIVNGTELELTGARTPGWVEENRDNPLREWDGREHISAARYKKAVAQYRATRSAVVAALSPESPVRDLRETGRDFADAFNKLDGTRNPFIETEERDDLFEALTATVAFAESQLGAHFPQAFDELAAGANESRNW